MPQVVSTLTHTKLYSFIPIYILQGFIEQFVHTSLIWYNIYIFSGSWQLFLIYEVIKKYKTSSVKKTSNVNKIKQILNLYLSNVHISVCILYFFIYMKISALIGVLFTI